MRCLNNQGKIAWKASPRFLGMLADAERDARDDLRRLAIASGDRDRNLPLIRNIFAMTDLEGMPSYFWLISSGLKKPIRDDVPYTTQALREDLLRVQNAWDESQASRERDAIYIYLTAVFELVAWWTAENRAVERAHKALRLRNIWAIRPHASRLPQSSSCTADPAKVDKRTRSKWSRALRYALVQKTPSESLVQFIKRKGGINRCAERFRARRRGRPSRLLSSE